MTNLRNLLTTAIKLIDDDWGGTSADSEGSVWLKEAREYLAALPVEPKREPVDAFVVKHYASDERPMIKGNGFDGLEIGGNREEAEEFVTWLNERLGVNRDGKHE